MKKYIPIVGIFINQEYPNEKHFWIFFIYQVFILHFTSFTILHLIINFFNS